MKRQKKQESKQVQNRYPQQGVGDEGRRWYRIEERKKNKWLKFRSEEKSE